MSRCTLSVLPTGIAFGCSDKIDITTHGSVDETRLGMEEECVEEQKGSPVEQGSQECHKVPFWS